MNTPYTVTNWRDARTYADLLLLKPYSYNGNCCACHGGGRDVWKLSTRAYICHACADRKGEKLLGSVERAERAARRWIKNHPAAPDTLVASVTGASRQRIAELRAALAKAGAL